MNPLAPVHGGGPADARIRHDLSTNANALGPCPPLLEAVRAADFTRYPDYGYTVLRRRLAAAHGVDADRIVVGPGASELILRLVRRHPGEVRILGLSFGEYARCAQLEGRRVVTALDAVSFASAQRLGEGLGFACLPNSPGGECWDLSVLEGASRRGLLVADLAYAHLCEGDFARRAEEALCHAVKLYSPNKAFGLTGVRAAYMVLPCPDDLLAHLGASWCLDAGGEALLAGVHESGARQWLAGTLPVLHSTRASLAGALRFAGFAVRESPANFLLAHLGPSDLVASSLAAGGFRLRDATSFGLPGWHRIGAPATLAVAGELAGLIAREIPVPPRSAQVCPVPSALTSGTCT